MNRRTALALLSTAAASPLTLGSPLRALAQATAARTLGFRHAERRPLLYPSDKHGHISGTTRTS